MYSRTRCRAQASQLVQSRLGAKVSSGPLFASGVGQSLELCSNLLSVVLMKDPAQRSRRSPRLAQNGKLNCGEARSRGRVGGKKERENNDLARREPFCLTRQNGGCPGPFQTDVELPLESARALCRFSRREKSSTSAARLVMIEGAHDIPASAIATRTIVRMIAYSANEAAGRSETGPKACCRTSFSTYEHGEDKR